MSERYCSFTVSTDGNGFSIQPAEPMELESLALLGDIIAAYQLAKIEAADPDVPLTVTIPIGEPVHIVTVRDVVKSAT